MSIDLKPFCGDQDIRHYLNQPFSEGEFTYATNGHILIRVSRRDDVPEISSANGMKNKIPQMFADVPADDPIEIPDILPLVESSCDCCNGDGRHSFQCGGGVDYECEECYGTGNVMDEQYKGAFPQIELRGTWFAPRYLRLIKTLPNSKIDPNGQKFVRFTFDGGDGLLMPMRKA